MPFSEGSTDDPAGSEVEQRERGGASLESQRHFDFEEQEASRGEMIPFTLYALAVGVILILFKRIERLLK